MNPVSYSYHWTAAKKKKICSKDIGTIIPINSFKYYFMIML